jgi:hypothetical protein
MPKWLIIYFSIINNCSYNENITIPMIEESAKLKIAKKTCEN